MDDTNDTIDASDANNTSDANDTFLTVFPKNIFGVIPPDITKMLIDSGFQNIVTLITVTDEDITEMETSCNIKLKLGHKRLLKQMVEYGKKLMPEIKPTSELPNTSTITKEYTPKPTLMVLKTANEDSVVAMLKRNIKKKTEKFCQMYNIKYIHIVDLQTIKTSDNEYNGADITCSCGESVKICTNRKRPPHTYWVLSNFTRHLNRYHLPQTNEECSINNFFEFASSNGSDDFEEDSKGENKQVFEDGLKLSYSERN